MKTTTIIDSYFVFDIRFHAETESEIKVGLIGDPAVGGDKLELEISAGEKPRRISYEF